MSEKSETTPTETTSVETVDQVESTTQETQPTQTPSTEVEIKVEESAPIQETEIETVATEITETKIPPVIELAHIPTEVIEPKNPLPDVTFDSLSETTKAAIQKMGWPSLMPVQSKTIPYMLEGRDMLIQSRTGSGKTGAFVIPLVEILVKEFNSPQALIMVPTRELAIQVHEEFERIAVGTPLKAACIYGGVGYDDQINAIKNGIHLVVATPGRLLDLLKQRKLDFSNIRDVVMDEADEMLSLGFYDDMKAVQNFLPNEYCTTLFSATIPESIKSLSLEFQAKERDFLSMSYKKISNDLLEHTYHVVDPMDKDRSIQKLLEFEKPDSCIIFCNMKRDVHYLEEFLLQNGYQVGALSGDVTQARRQKTLKAFRDKKLKVLIATDVAARGIDVSHVTHVLLHDHPEDNEVYIHRAGRTARAGKSGKAISIVTPVEEITIKKTAEKFDLHFIKAPMPTDEEVEKKICDRLLVHLEHKYKDLTPVVKRRVSRFNFLADFLHQTESQKELLAMILEDYYRQRGGEL
ncbi:DEAD/DEAH box helicase [Fibrobacterales bacterium]|nr:DEAD/DEAH box helicase [Fibrobacterales bacterium]